MDERRDDIPIEDELEDLRHEIERFKREKERVRAIVGRIGGVPASHSKLINYSIALLIVACLVISLFVHNDIVRLAMVELAIAILSLKLIYLINGQMRVNHFQLWVLTSLEWRMVEMLGRLKQDGEENAPGATDEEPASPQ